MRGSTSHTSPFADEVFTNVDVVVGGVVVVNVVVVNFIVVAHFVVVAFVEISLWEKNVVSCGGVVVFIAHFVGPAAR